MQLHKILNEKKDKTKDSQKSIDIMAAVNAKGDGVSGGIQTDGSKEGELAAKKELATKHKAGGGKKKTLFKTKLIPRDPKVGGVPPPKEKKLAEGILGEEENMTPEEVKAANHKSAKRAMGGLPVPGKKTRELIIKGGKRRGKIPSEPDTDIDEGRDPNSLHKLLEFNMDKGRTNKSQLNAAAGTEPGMAHRKGRIAVGTARFNRESDEEKKFGEEPKVHNRSNFNMSPEDRLAYVAAKGKHQSGTKAAQGFATKRKAKAKANANESTQYPNLHKLLEANYSAKQIRSGARTLPSDKRTGGSAANRRGDRAIGLHRIKTGSNKRGVHPSSDGERAAQGSAEGNYESGKIMARAYGRMRKRLSGEAKNESTQYPNLHNLLESKRAKTLRKAVGIDRIKRGSASRGPTSFPGYDNMQSSNPDIRARSNKAYQYDASKRVAQNRAIRNSQ